VADDRQKTPRGRLVAVVLDDTAMRQSTPHVDRERAAALRDLLADNVFVPVGRPDAEFHLRLAITDRRLVFDVRDDHDRPMVTHVLSMTRLRRVIRDYFVICDAYYSAVGRTPPAQFEAIDIGRRGLHDEGAELLSERLAGKIELDHATARNLFTLIAALCWTH
jgi:uncharacterized protein (UPF0262 family)